MRRHPNQSRSLSHLQPSLTKLILLRIPIYGTDTSGQYHCSALTNSSRMMHKTFHALSFVLHNLSGKGTYPIETAIPSLNSTRLGRQHLISSQPSMRPVGTISIPQTTPPSVTKSKVNSETSRLLKSKTQAKETLWRGSLHPSLNDSLANR